jgi:hypothetical protein
MLMQYKALTYSPRFPDGAVKRAGDFTASRTGKDPIASYREFQPGDRRWQGPGRLTALISNTSSIFNNRLLVWFDGPDSVLFIVSGAILSCVYLH